MGPRKQKKQSIVISIRLDDVALKAVDLLVESGLESNRSRAASHFINIGIQASGELLQKAQLLADHVHGLRNEMIEAVKINNLEKVKELVEQDETLINARNHKGDTAVLMSAYYRASEIRELLTSRGAELNIFEACAIGNTSRVSDILDTSPSLINSHSSDGFTLLGLAAHFGNDETVRLLFQRGADVNARSSDGNLNNMAIHAAIAGNHEHVVKTLLLHGADVNASCEGKWRPGYRPLHVAAYFGRESIAAILLQHGADKHAQNANGQTPHLLAIQKGHPELAQLLA